MFIFTRGASRRVQVMSSKNRKFGPPWPSGRSLSCRCLRKNYVGLRGDWQLVTLTRLFLSSKNKKKKTLMNRLGQNSETTSLGQNLLVLIIKKMCNFVSRISALNAFGNLRHTESYWFYTCVNEVSFNWLFQPFEHAVFSSLLSFSVTINAPCLF